MLNSIITVAGIKVHNRMIRFEIHNLGKGLCSPKPGHSKNGKKQHRNSTPLSTAGVYKGHGHSGRAAAKLTAAGLPSSLLRDKRISGSHTGRQIKVNNAFL